MSRLVAGTLLLPDGTPMAGASIYFTAKRTEPDAIVKGIDAFFKTNSTGIYSQEIENGWYTVTIEYQLSGTYPRRWALGEVVIEDGPTTTLNALIIAMTPPDDPNLGIFQQLLLEAQEARDEAIAAANAAQEAAATISPEKQAQWDEAYSDRMKWSGGDDGLDAAAGRTSLQLKSAALQESTAFATAAQGATADQAWVNANSALSGLDQKIDSSEKGAANGIAPLGPNKLIQPEFLPSYVDDVLEFDTYADLPVPGETGKIYIVKTAGNDGTDSFPANQQFRWSGTAYIKLVASPGTTDNVVEGLINLYFTGMRAISAKLTGFVAAVEEFAVSPADSILGALQKVVGRLNQLGTASNLNAGADADDLPTNANLNARLGTEGNLGAAAQTDYATQRIELVNIPAGQYINCTRIGNLVTVSSEETITHLSSPSLVFPEIIPIYFRPALGVISNVYYFSATGVGLVLIRPNGDMEVLYQSVSTAAPAPRVNSAASVNVAYVVAS
jgi:hypothetical protein